MYKIVEKEKKVIPHYLVTFSYMINDADEYVDKESSFYEDEFDEAIQKAVRVLDEFSKIDIRRYSDYYTHRLCLGHLKIVLENELMSEEEQNILSAIILGRGDDNYDNLVAYWGDEVPSTMTKEVFEKYKKYAALDWIDLGLEEESDLGYYHLQSVKVEYVDENSAKHKVNWED